MRPCVAQAGRMLVLRETTSCSPAVTVKVEPPLRTDGWTSSTCCLGGKKSKAAIWRLPKTKEVNFFFCLGERTKTMPWAVSMCSLLMSVLNSRGKRNGVGFGDSTSSAWRCGLRWFLSLSLGSEKEDNGRTGEGGAPAATSVPVPRPVARRLADRRQVRMQLLASFTHGAPNPLRICVPREHHTTCLKSTRLFFVCILSLCSRCMNVLDYFTTQLQLCYYGGCNRFSRCLVCAEAICC